MARDDTLTFPEGVWTELTANDTDAMTFQSQGGGDLVVKPTEGPAPASFAGSFDVNPGEGFISIKFADVSPGITAVRCWAYSLNGSGKVAVSHA